jgi:hypothetical protein
MDFFYREMRLTCTLISDYTAVFQNTEWHFTNLHRH